MVKVIVICADCAAEYVSTGEDPADRIEWFLQLAINKGGWGYPVCADGTILCPDCLAQEASP